jgi:hypothetical protein
MSWCNYVNLLQMPRQNQEVVTSPCLPPIPGKDENNNEKMVGNGRLIHCYLETHIALLQRFPNAVPSPPDKGPSEHAISEKLMMMKLKKLKVSSPHSMAASVPDAVPKTGKSQDYT